jgi:hypothetical protein
MTCPTCGVEMIQKSRGQILLAGVIFLLAPLVTLGVPYVWGPAILLALIGLYLVVWATVGRGLWCRSCKRFGSFSSARRARKV